MGATDYPIDGHDIYPDFKLAMTFLGTKAHEEKTIKDPVNTIRMQFPEAAIDDITRSVKGCPLRKNSDQSYSFIHPSIGHYLAVLAIAESFEENSDKGLDVQPHLSSPR